MATPRFYKYNDSPTVYGSTGTGQDTAYSSPDQFVAAGGKQDFSNVETLQRGQQLSQIKDQLNQFQNDTFQQQNQPPQRQAFSLEQQIADQGSQVDSTLADFQKLTESYKAIQQPNLYDTFVGLREQQGIPALETQFTDISKQRRELPYVERAAEGNAAPTTEAQLGANVQQKDVPLYIQQSNLIDRLKLANDFVNTGVQLKDTDVARSRESILNAANLVSQTLGQARQHLLDLQSQQQTQNKTVQDARQFALENSIQQPFFNIGGTVYRTSDGKAYSTPEQFMADGGAKDFSNVQTVTGSNGDTKFMDIGTDENGNPIRGFVDTASKTVYDLNGQKLNFNTNATGMRTDRHNNPTAMTTDVAKTLGLVEGVDYVAGDSFDNNGDGKPDGITATFLGDPLQTTIKALDTAAKDSSKQAFYTQGGKQRWTYIGLSDQQWLSLNTDEKKKVVASMYQHEGGNGSLLNPSAGQDTQTVQAAMRTLSSQLSEGARKAFTANINGLVKDGNLVTAANDIITNAIDSEPAALQEKLYGKFTAINQLNQIEGLLKDFKDKGGKTDILNGTFEQISQKVGVTSNPDLAYLWNRIQTAVVSYRNAVSGAAFTESERQQYDQLFPAIRNNIELNSAKISALRDSFNTDIKSNLSAKLGSTNYDGLMKVISQASDPIGKYVQDLSNVGPEEEYVNSLFNSSSSAPTSPGFSTPQDSSGTLGLNPLSLPASNQSTTPSLTPSVLSKKAL